MNRFTLPFYQSLALLLFCLPFLISCGTETNDNSTDTNTYRTILPVLPVTTETGHWANVAIAIKIDINESLTLAQAGETKLAMRKMGQAYFQQFEGSKMETALRVQISPKHMLKVEKLFGNLRKSIKAEAEAHVLKQQAAAIIQAVTRDAKILDSAGIQAELLEGM